MVQSALAEARFLDNTTLICAGRDGLCAYNVDKDEMLWQSNTPATAIAVAGNGSASVLSGGGNIAIATINNDDDFTTLFDKNGTVRKTVDFGGRRQRTYSDARWNPRDSLFALSADGQFLAVSFENGVLLAIETLTLEGFGYGPVEGNARYCGGFSGSLLAFSATNDQGSSFVVYDMESLEEVYSTDSKEEFDVLSNESGIFLSWSYKVGQYNPQRGEIWEIAWAEKAVNSFSVGDGYIILAWNDAYAIFDRIGIEIARFERNKLADISLLSGDHALIGDRFSLDLTVLQRQDDARIFTLDDSGYDYSEARISADGSRVMLFSLQGFRLYDRDGTLIREQVIPDWKQIFDQQYSKKSGNLAVIYKDALTIYSGNTGEAIFKKTNLSSVFYAPYGISILDINGQLQLIDLDTGKVGMVFPEDTVIEGTSYAAYCGVIVDSAFLDGRKLIGAAETADGYIFAISDDVICAIYDGEGKKQFEVPVRGQAEACFTETAVVISPANGIASAFNLKSGRKLADLEINLTYVTDLGEYVVCQYLSPNGKQYGVILDKTFEPIADLDKLCDICDGQLLFDYQQGVLRSIRVFGFNELVELARAGYG